MNTRINEIDYNMKQTYHLLFKGFHYSLAVEAGESALAVKLTESSLVDYWEASFSSSYIQEITTKTGQKVPYHRFVEQFCAILSAPSEHNYIQVLTAHDIESLKAKKSGQPQKEAAGNKRYLIVSMTIGGLKLHYPLTLGAVECRDEKQLRDAIVRLQSTMSTRRKDSSVSSLLQKSKSTDFEVDQIQRENQILKSEIAVIQRRESLKRGAVEMDQILRSKLEIQSRIANLQKDKGKIIARYKLNVAAKEKEIAAHSSQLEAIRKEMQKAENNDPNAMNRLKNYAMKAIKITEFQVNSTKKLITKLAKEKTNLIRKLDQTKNNEKKSLAKIKKLIGDIENARKKTNIAELANRLSKGTSSVGSKASGASSLSKGSSLVSKPSGTRSQQDRQSQKSQASKDSHPKSNASMNNRIANNRVPNKNLAKPVIPPQSNLRRTMPTEMNKKNNGPIPKPGLSTTNKAPAAPVAAQKRQTVMDARSVAARKAESVSYKTSLEKQRSVGRGYSKAALVPSKDRTNKIPERSIPAPKSSMQNKLNHLSQMIQKARK